MTDSIKKLEEILWKSADDLRANSKISSTEYFMPVLGLIFLRYAYSRFKKVEAEILPTLPSRGGKTRPITADDFKGHSAIFLPREAQYEYIVNLPEDVSSENIIGIDGNQLTRLYEVVNNAMKLIEQNTENLDNVLPKNYQILGNDSLLKSLIRIFNNTAIDEVEGDVFGRIYEYFLNNFSQVVAQDDGVFFTPKSLVKMIVNVIEPKEGKFLDPACGSGGMFVQTGDFISAAGQKVNQKMTFYGQEKVELNAKICLMNIAVHGINGQIKSGDEANSFYHDAFNLEGKCDYIMANPPFNVDSVGQEQTQAAGRLPFGLPAYNKEHKIGNANYLWIQYFYAYLNPTGRAGFVMASSATDSSNRDREIRQQLIETGHVDCMLTVANNFFYTKSLPCTLWFFDKGKRPELKNKTLFIDARHYYTVLNRTTNTWTDWQLKNLSAIVWLYRGETDKYQQLIAEYQQEILDSVKRLDEEKRPLAELLDEDSRAHFLGTIGWIKESNLDIEMLKRTISEQIQQTQKCVKLAEQNLEKRKVNPMRLAGDDFVAILKALLTLVEEYEWLTSKFGFDGCYQDILGLCKIADQEEMKEKNYSLTPGAYVGVEEKRHDGIDYHARMKEIHEELLALQAKSNELFCTIDTNFEELGL